MNTAREDILARIRTSLGPASTDPSASHSQIAREFRQHGELTFEARLELLIDRLLDYDTEILQLINEDEISAAIADVLLQAEETCVVAPADFPARWLPTAPDIVLQFDSTEQPLSTAAIESAQTVLTTCEVAIASTGTIILVHHRAQGRRVLTLLPDHHICIVHRNQVVELVSEALARLPADMAQPITTISGPSATSDIEMTRIRGVHGPRRLTVVLYGEVQS